MLMAIAVADKTRTAITSNVQFNYPASSYLTDCDTV